MADFLKVAAPIVLGVVALACASSPRSEGSVSSRRMLLGDEIQTASVATAYEAVSRLRPEWLRRRGQISFRQPDAGEVVVYVNGMRRGGAAALTAVTALSVVRMEFLSGTVATTRYGTGHGGGAILVDTR